MSEDQLALNSVFPVTEKKTEQAALDLRVYLEGDAISETELELGEAEYVATPLTDTHLDLRIVKASSSAIKTDEDRGLEESLGFSEDGNEKHEKTTDDVKNDCQTEEHEKAAVEGSSDTGMKRSRGRKTERSAKRVRHTLRRYISESSSTSSSSSES